MLTKSQIDLLLELAARGPRYWLTLPDDSWMGLKREGLLELDRRRDVVLVTQRGRDLLAATP